MQFILGKRTYPLDAAALQLKRKPYLQTWVDIGSGDGRFVLHAASANPGVFTIGVDACRENLASASRKAPPNALFLIANALALPEELGGLAARLTIHFPWGSLLEGLLRADPGLLRGLSAVACPGARLDVLLNAGALAEAGVDLERGAGKIRDALESGGIAAEPRPGDGNRSPARLSLHLGAPPGLRPRPAGAVVERNLLFPLLMKGRSRIGRNWILTMDRQNPEGSLASKVEGTYEHKTCYDK